MGLATDADFNNASRYLSMKIELYFNGLESAPLTVTKDDYLVDTDWLEEGSAESSNPFGTISSNELSFRLFNKDGMFSPTNTSGAYFGLIKSGVCIIPYIKPINAADDLEWIKLGVYYVTGWTAAITSIYAEVVANDKWQTILNSSAPNYKVERNVTFKEAYDNVFNLMGFDVTVDEALTQLLVYSFTEGTPQNFLQELAKGSLVYCTSDKNGVPTVNPFIATRSVRATLTDGDQIKSVESKQSIIKAYDGVELTYSIPQGITQSKLVELQDISIMSGESLLPYLAFDIGPLWQINSVTIHNPTEAIQLTRYVATPWLISLYLNNPNAASVLATILVYGTTVGFTDVVLSDEGTKILKVASRYIQTAEYAAVYKTVLNAFVNSTIPLLTVSVRGNPLLNIGDRISIQSTRYNLIFDGVIQRMKYAYNGSLSCEMTLLNNSVIQGVS